MQKLDGDVGIKIIGMQKEDGTCFTKNDQERIVLTTDVELYSREDLPELINWALDFNIPELISFLEKCRAEGKTNVSFFGAHSSPEIKVRREEFINLEQYKEYLTKTQQIAKEEILASDISEEEKVEALGVLVEDKIKDLLFVERGLQIDADEVYRKTMEEKQSTL